MFLSLALTYRGNAIGDEHAIEGLRLVSKSLRALVLSENPLGTTKDCRLSVLGLVPQLERIDKDPVSLDEQNEALERIGVKK